MGALEIFGGQSRWTTYEAALQVHTLVGGIPKDPDTIRGWLKARLDLEDAEIMAIAEETIAEMGWTSMTSGNLDELVDEIVTKSAKGNSFKQVNGELVFEGRCLKAALKEAANIVYPWPEPWPGMPKTTDKKSGEEKAATRKGFKSWFEERVEVKDTFFPLGRSRPDEEGQQRIKHPSGPGGKRSTINVVDVCYDVKLTARIAVLDDCILPEIWRDIWESVELGGVGADRGRGDGRGELVGWRKLEDAPVAPRSSRRSSSSQAKSAPARRGRPRRS